MSYDVPQVHPAAVRLAATHLPGWLADQVAAWITDTQGRGHGFTSARVAVRCALESLSQGAYVQISIEREDTR